MIATLERARSLRAIADRRQCTEDEAAMLRELADEQQERAEYDAWVRANLVANERAGVPDKHGIPEGALRLRNTRKTTWAFMAWNVC